MKITRRDKQDELVEDIFYQEVVRELLAEIGAPTDDAFVKEMWERCKPNPWDAPLIYQITKKLGDDA